jgi:hypothetical protein
MGKAEVPPKCSGLNFLYRSSCLTLLATREEEAVVVETKAKKRRGDPRTLLSREAVSLKIIAF